MSVTRTAADPWAQARRRLLARRRLTAGRRPGGGAGTVRAAGPAPSARPPRRRCGGRRRRGAARSSARRSAVRTSRPPSWRTGSASARARSRPNSPAGWGCWPTRACSLTDPERAARRYILLVATEVTNRSYWGVFPLPEPEVRAMVTAGVQDFLRLYAP